MKTFGWSICSEMNLNTDGRFSFRTFSFVMSPRWSLQRLQACIYLCLHLRPPSRASVFWRVFKEVKVIRFMCVALFTQRQPLFIFPGLSGNKTHQINWSPYWKHSSLLNFTAAALQWLFKTNKQSLVWPSLRKLIFQPVCTKCDQSINWLIIQDFNFLFFTAEKPTFSVTFPVLRHNLKNVITNSWICSVQYVGNHHIWSY